MSAIAMPNVLTFKAGAAISKGMVVKPGADDQHILKSALATSKNFGIAMNDATTADDKVEVALPGGGAKALLGGTVAFGDMLTSDANGKCVATTTPGDRVIGVAMQDGVANDLIAAHVVSFLI